MKKITLFCAGVLSFSTLLTFAGNKATVIIPGDHFPTSFRMDPRVKEGDYLPNTVIFKVKPQYRQNCKVNSIDNILRIQDLLNAVGAQNFAKIYPNHREPEKKFNEVGMPLVDISLIYSFKYTSNQSLEKVINQFLALGYFEFVEPWYVPKIQLVPNDPNYSNSGQYFCKGNVAGSIDCQNAWNTQTGSASVIIGIVDTGTEPTHPDLAPTYAGGIDLGMNDADPTWEGKNHGCAVSGDACAATNNGIGVASPAGIGCKFKGVKISDATGALIAAYTGITWAADNGCNIINCSWGGPGGGTYGQTIVDYAAINMNRLVLAAAGNDGKDQDLWPSAYNNVYRVAGTTNTDAKAGFTDYGFTVDFGSPGNIIYSTIDKNNGTGYGAMTGTSMSCPVAAGAAAIVQSQFNYPNALQIGERLKQTCDPYASSASALFNAGKLGKGRIDLAKAVAATGAKSVVMNPITVTDGNDNVFLPGETLTLTGSFINYLDPTSSSAAAVLSVNAGPGTVVNANSNVGVMATLATQPAATPFTATVSAGAGINAIITFKVTITDGAFSGTQYFDVTVNPDYINIVNNDVNTTITSKGRIGYNLDATKEGLGFMYMVPTPTVQMLYEMSLMIGTSATSVSDMFREAGTGNTDFASVQRAYKAAPAVTSDFDVHGKFNDAANTTPAPIPVDVRHSAYAWSTAPFRRFVIVKYVIKNTGGSALSNVAVGVIADYDIVNAAQNKGGTDAVNAMGWAQDVSTANGTFAAIKLLGAKTSSGTPIGSFNNYIIDLVAGGNGGVDAGADFLVAEKYQTMTTSRPADGYPGTGGDVMVNVSSMGLSIPAGDSITVAFALIGGDDLADIQLSACQAQNKYDGTTNPCLTGINSVETPDFWLYSYPNPSAGMFNIDYNLIGYENATISLINTLGETVMTFGNLVQGEGRLMVDASGLPAGPYFCRMKSGEMQLTKKLSIVK